MVGWHWHKALGVLLELNDKEKRVSISAPGMIDQVINELLKDSVTITPKHIMTEDFDDLPSGEVPALDDPQRGTILAEQALTRHALLACSSMPALRIRTS